MADIHSTIDQLCSVEQLDFVKDVNYAVDDDEDEEEAAERARREAEIEKEVMQFSDGDDSDEDDFSDDESGVSSTYDPESHASNPVLRNGHNSENLVDCLVTLDEGDSPPNNIYMSRLDPLISTSTTIESVNGGYNSHNTSANNSCANSQNESSGSNGGSYENQFSNPNSQYVPSQTNYGVVHYPTGIPVTASNPSQMNYNHHAAGVPATGIPNFPLTSPQNNFSDVLHPKNIPHTNLIGDSRFINGLEQGKTYQDLRDEHVKLRQLHENVCQELERTQKREKVAVDEFTSEIRSLSIKIELLEGEKATSLSKLDECQKRISDFIVQNKKLEGKITALESQLTSVTDAKNQAQSELEASFLTIEKLQRQLKGMHLPNSLSRLQKQHDSIISDLKLRHQNEVLELKKSIDKLESDLKSKSQDAKHFEDKLADLQKKYDKLGTEKNEIFNDLSTKLEASNRRLQQHLDSEQVDVSILKSQIKSLEEDKIKLNEQNRELMDRNKSLENELHTSKAMQRVATSPLPPYKSESSESELEKYKSELENALKNLWSQRQEINTLQKELADKKAAIQNLHDKSTHYHTRSDDYEKKCKDLEDKLLSLTTNEMEMKTSYEEKVEKLEKEAKEFRIKFQNATEKQKQTSKKEKNLAERCEKLQKKVTEMIERHAEEKKKAIEDCRNQCMEIHEKEMKVIKDKFNSESATELQCVCAKYENKIANLQKDLDEATMKLHEAQQDYLKICEENKGLQKALDESTRPKERAEIEACVRAEYDNKLVLTKEQLQQENEKYFSSHLETEITKIQSEWTKQKQVEVKNFIESRIKKLDVRFKDILHKEQTALHQILNREKENYEKSYRERVQLLKHEYEKEKQTLNANLNQHCQSELEKRCNHFKKQHEEQIDLLKKDYEKKIRDLEKEIKNQQLEVQSKKGSNNELEELKELFSRKESEIEQHLSTIAGLTAALKDQEDIENKLREKVNKYKKHYERKEKDHMNEVSALRRKVSDLQKKQETIQLDKDNYKQQLQKAVDEQAKKQVFSRSCEIQTEEEVVLKRENVKMKKLFIAWLRNRIEEMKQYLKSAQARSVEHQRQSFLKYLDQLASLSFQDLTKKIYSFPQSVTAVQTRVKTPISSSPTFTFDVTNTAQNFCSTKIRTSPAANNIVKDNQNKVYANRADPMENFASRSLSQPNFEDLSFDFQPSNLPQSTFDSRKPLTKTGFSRKRTDSHNKR